MTEWIVSSVVLIAVVALVRQLLKGKISLRLQYALWAIVLVRLLVPITFGESKISVLNVLDEASSVVEHQEPAEEPTVSDPAWEPIGGSPAPIPTAPVMTPGATIAPDPVVPEQPEPVVPILPDPGMNSDPVTEPDPPAVDEPVGAPVVTAAQILTVLWLCGIAVVGLWFLFTNLRFWLRLRRSRRVLELDCPIRVYVTGAAETPCLFGLIRPAIYLTPEVAEDEVALRHVLAHELTHYHHWDHVWSVLRCVCLAVHWYNPLVWLAASLSRRDAELACDESTIRRIGEEERTAYGRTLIGLTCVHRSNLLHTATTMTGSKKSLKERIVLIAKKPKMAIYTLVAVILIAAIAVGCTFTGAAGTPEKGFLSWVEALKETDFGSTLRAATSKGGLNQDQYARLYDILGTIEEKDFSELPEKFEGLDPNHMIVVGTSLDPYLYIKGMGEEVTKGEWTFYCNDDGTIAVTASYDVAKKYNFDAWRLLDCPELYEFIVELNQDEKVPSDTPQAVLDCAEQVLADRLAEHIQENGKGERTELIGLKQHETGTAGLNDAVCIYRITYNLHWDNAFEYHQHYMALGYDSVTDEYTLLDNFTADELVARYGTEEMLAKYDGDMFVAAAMEAYAEWKKDTPEPADPSAERLADFQKLLTWDGGTTLYNGAISCIFDSPEDIDLACVFYDVGYFTDGGEWQDFTEEEKAYLIAEGAKKNLGFGEIPAQKRTARQLEQALQDYFGVTLSDVRIPDEWVYYAATDSYYSSHGDVRPVQNFTVTKVEQGEGGLVYVYYTTFGPLDPYDTYGVGYDMVLTLQIQASRLNNPHGYAVVANQTLSDFEAFTMAAEKAVDPAQISVRAKTPYQAAGNYVEAWGKAYSAQMPYFIRDYRLIDWGVEQISADGKAVSGWLYCSILPTREYDAEGGIQFSAGNAGYLYGSFTFVLEEQDGIWMVAGWDKLGGISLEDCGYTPMEGIEATVTGFLNEYLTELYCCTNSNWLDYTTGGIHIYEVDELSEADRAIVWEAERNISYLDDKATYWKLSRREQGISRTEFSISYSDMKIKQSGNRATVNVDAWMSFVYEGETERSGLQEPHEIQLAKINGVWLITDVMQEVFWFDYDYKDDREALDKEIEYLESQHASKIQMYDMNGDGMIQSTEFPYAEGEAFGLTGEYATLYTAVAEYVMRGSGNVLGGRDLTLPRIARVYGKYEDKAGNMNYICGMNTMYYYGLGAAPGQWPANHTGGAGDFVLATVDPDGYLVGFKTAPDGMNTIERNQLYREYCGPLEDLAEAFINGTEDAYAEELMTEYRNEGPRLAQYLSYYFGE